MKSFIAKTAVVLVAGVVFVALMPTVQFLGVALVIKIALSLGML